MFRQFCSIRNLVPCSFVSLSPSLFLSLSPDFLVASATSGSLCGVLCLMWFSTFSKGNIYLKFTVRIN